MKMQERIAENAKNSAISAVSGFSKSQPQGLDTDGVLQEGDIILMPATLPEVFKQTFGMRTNPTTGQPEENYGEFIVVDVQGKDGEIRAINFFPSSLTKNIWPAKKEADGTVVTITENGPMNPKGAAVDIYKAEQGKTGPNGETDMELGVRALLGKKIEVSSKTPVEVQRWRNGATVNEIRTTNLFEYNIAA